MKPLLYFTVVALMLLTNTGCEPSKKEESPPSNDQPKAISNPEDAKRFLLGVWTKTQNPVKYHAGGFIIYYWLRIHFLEDGKLEFNETSPTSSEWGAPDVYPYEIITSKYATTGERFYAAKFNGRSERFTAIIQSDGTIRLRRDISFDPENDFDDAVLKKGDANPFSK